MKLSAGVSAAVSGAGCSSRSGFARGRSTERGPEAGVAFSSRAAAMDSIGVMGVMLASDMAVFLNPMLGVGIIFPDSCVVNDFFCIPDQPLKHSFDTVYGQTCSLKHNPHQLRRRPYTSCLPEPCSTRRH